MNESTVVIEYEFGKQLIHEIHSVKDNCIRICHNKSFRTFEYKCVYNFKLTKNGNIEIVDLTFSDEAMVLYELIKKLKIARENGFTINQIPKFKKKLKYSIKYKYTLLFKILKSNIAGTFSQNSISKSTLIKSTL